MRQMDKGCPGVRAGAFRLVTVAFVASATLMTLPGCSGNDAPGKTSENVEVADLRIVDAGVKAVDASLVDATPVSDPCATALMQAAPGAANLCCYLADNEQGAFQCIEDSCDNGCTEPSAIQVCADENGVAACQNACRGAAGGYLTGEILNGKKCGGAQLADAAAAPVTRTQ